MLAIEEALNDSEDLDAGNEKYEQLQMLLARPKR